MGYFNRLFVVGIAAGLSSLTGCDKASLGEYETEGGTDSEGSGSGSASSTSGGSASASSGTGTATGDPTSSTGTTTTGATDSAGTATTGGDPLCSVTELFTCEDGIDCDGGCGGLSRWDENGCLRSSCGEHADCADDELCYVGEWFGECVASDVFCDVGDDGVCECGSTDDCSGRFCVPQADYPLAHEMVEVGPGGPGRHQPGCAPNDASARDFQLGVDDATCGLEPATTGLYFQLMPPIDYGFYVWNVGVTGGWYDVDGDGDFDPGESLEAGSVVIEQIDGDTLGGRYEFKAGDTLVHGTFSDLPLCDTPMVCG